MNNKAIAVHGGIKNNTKDSSDWSFKILGKKVRCLGSRHGQEIIVKSF